MRISVWSSYGCSSDLGVLLSVALSLNLSNDRPAGRYPAPWFPWSPDFPPPLARRRSPDPLARLTISLSARFDESIALGLRQQQREQDRAAFAVDRAVD